MRCTVLKQRYFDGCEAPRPSYSYRFSAARCLIWYNIERNICKWYHEVQEFGEIMTEIWACCFIAHKSAVEISLLFPRHILAEYGNKMTFIEK